VVVAHADDLAFFCAGRVASWADEGWRVVVCRVTNDDKDSVGLDKAETERRNSSELRAAASILGVSQIEELGFETDTLGDVSEVALRERLIRLYRRHKPYATLTFDPYGAFHEDNQDHIRVAQASDEAYWTAKFDKHHPEHFAEGLAPHAVYERWYFARRLQEVTEVLDVSPYIERLKTALSAHRTMLSHMVHQWRMEAETAGLQVPLLQNEISFESLAGTLVEGGAGAVGQRHGLPFAEEYRVARSPVEFLAKL
jgi:LmbE family N-acetylglucosaminyl deacetylase